MKVYFGPFTNRWQSKIQDKWLNYKYGTDWWTMTDDQFTKFDKFVYKVEDILQIIYNATINKILDNRKRKIKVVVHNYDVWGADHTIAMLVHPLLVKLKGQKHGSPIVDDEDVPEHLRSTAANPKENEWDIDDNTHARWDWAMDEMIWAFEQCAKDDTGDSQFYSGEVDWTFEKDSDTGLSRIMDGPKNTFKVDHEGKKAHYDRIKNGLRLFSKYYFSLWD